MTLDVTSFIDNKGGNSEEIRESQRKRGHSVEVVDEVIQMYQDWVKRTSCPYLEEFCSLIFTPTVDFEANGLSKQSNALQKQIGLKKKVCTGPFCREMSADILLRRQRKTQMTSLQRRRVSMRR
jgi:seryl-tRNA synthetase